MFVCLLRLAERAQCRKQTDARMSSIEVKVKKLDSELGRYKEQMSKLRNGPGKVYPTARDGEAPLTDRPSVIQDAVQQRALRTLKQKRLYESQLAQLAQQTFNMESAALTTENLRNTMATVDAMQAANKEMRKQYGKIDIDKIEVRCCIYVLLVIDTHRISEYALRYGRFARAGERNTRIIRTIVCCAR